MTTKKILIPTVLLLTFLTSFGQIKKMSSLDKVALNFNTVKCIEIRNNHGSKAITKRLNIPETKRFIVTFNSAKPNGLFKFIVQYWVDVSLKDGRKRIFRVNGSNIKEDSDYCFDLGDDDFLRTLWKP